jgi:hypothetical protein
MDIKEADDIIANYMGNDFLIRYFELKKVFDKSEPGVITAECIELTGHIYGKEPSLYSTSIDMLVPVWEKLGPNMVGVIKLDFHLNQAMFVQPKEKKSGYIKGETLAQAAAISTAKAILELEEEK